MSVKNHILFGLWAVALVAICLLTLRCRKEPMSLAEAKTALEAAGWVCSPDNDRGDFTGGFLVGKAPIPPGEVFNVRRELRPGVAWVVVADSTIRLAMAQKGIIRRHGNFFILADAATVEAIEAVLAR